MIWSIGVLTTVLGAVAFNSAVDPYGMMGALRIDGFNKEKPRLVNNIRLAKAYGVRRYAPRSVVLGTSRVEVGIAPDDPAWPAADRPVYNLGLSGGTIYEALRYLEHAQSSTTLRTAIVGLDLEAFLTADDTMPGFSELRLAVDVEGRPRTLAERAVQFGRDLVLTNATMEAAWASVETVVRNVIHSRDLRYRADGSRDMSDVAAGTLRAGGYRVQFSPPGLIERARARLASGCRETVMDSRELFSNQMVRGISAFQQLLKFAKREGIALKLFISPLHAWKLQVYDGMGLWPTFEDWKRVLVRTVADVYPDASDKRPIIVDFSGYSRFATEPVPLPGDARTEMRWYWDPNHFRRSIGALILSRLFAENASENHPDDGFGTAITLKNVDAHIAAIRAAKANYERQRPFDAYSALLEGLIQRATNCAKIADAVTKLEYARVNLSATR